MGQLVFILGRSGTGKSYSMRTFPKDKLAVINVQGKILPFKGAAQIESTPTDQSDKITKALEIYAKDYKSIVIDDYQYTMANEFMRRSAERGYDKFTEIGRHAWDIANKVRELPADVIVYVMCHTDRDDEGNEKIKTIGKLLDEKICLEGMSTIVLKTNVSDGVYSFLTQNNGKDTVKSPAGMFPSYAVDNDLYYVDQKIRNYYELGEHLTDAEMAEIDEAAKKDDIPIKDEKKKRGSRRGKEKEEELAETPVEEKKEEAGAAEETGGTTEQPKSRRSRRHNDGGSTGGSSEVDGNNEESERPISKHQRKSVKDDLKEEREAVKQENEQTIVNAGLEEAGDREEVPFEEVKEPELKEGPRRKRRGNLETADKQPEAETPEEPAAKPRRRKRA